jgi:hypothetical protein
MPYRDYQKHLEYMRNYYHTHKEERAKYDKIYRQQHLDDIRKQQRGYDKTHRKERNIYNRKWRKEVKDFLIEKHGKICVVCGKEPKGSYLVFHEKNFKSHDHITPNQIKKIWQNFVPLCRNCHRTLHHFRLHKENFEKLLI